jgi:hypothetical protein
MYFCLLFSQSHGLSFWEIWLRFGTYLANCVRISNFIPGKCTLVILANFAWTLSDDQNLPNRSFPKSPYFVTGYTLPTT